VFYTPPIKKNKEYSFLHSDLDDRDGLGRGLVGLIAISLESVAKDPLCIDHDDKIYLINIARALNVKCHIRGDVVVLCLIVTANDLEPLACVSLSVKRLILSIDVERDGHLGARGTDDLAHLGGVVWVPASQAAAAFNFFYGIKKARGHSFKRIQEVQGFQEGSRGFNRPDIIADIIALLLSRY
jgi:hypothetical protein